MTRKILECDMESCYKNISKIRNISFIFQNYEKKFSTKKIVNIYLDCEKSMNLFEKKETLPDYLLKEHYFWQFVNNFLKLL